MSQEFTGKVDILSNEDKKTIILDGGGLIPAIPPSNISVLRGGSISLKDLSGNDSIFLDGTVGRINIGSQGNAGDIMIRNDAGDVTIKIDGKKGDIAVWQKINGINREVMKFSASYAALHIGSQDNAGDLFIKDSKGQYVLHFDSNEAKLRIGEKGNGGEVFIQDDQAREVFHFDTNRASLRIGFKGKKGDLIIKDGQGRDVFTFDSNKAKLRIGEKGNEGDIIVRDGAGNERIHLDGNQGDILLQNADCAEEFAVKDLETIESGTVMVIDEGDSLCPSTEAYDKRVAGVVSGASDLKPGLILDKQPESTNRMPIALMGKVYCKVDAQYASIEVGDLLTTSPTVGHAMKASDPQKAFGTVIGKALRPLKTGKGLIPILVTLL